MSVWRVTSLFVYEDGPYDIFEKIRHEFGMKRDELNNSYGTTVISRALQCFWCTSIWTSLILSIPLFYIIDIHIYEMTLVILSASSIAILFDMFVEYKV